MKNNGLVSYLYKRINEACFVVSQAYNTTQYYANNVLNSSESVMLSIVNFYEKTCNMLSTDLDPTMEVVISKTYRNNKLYTIEYNDLTQNSAISRSTINYSTCSYDNLFKPCGELYPVNLDDIVPIDNCKNSKKFQAYTMGKQMACNIDGYVSSLITIEVKGNNLFLITCNIETVDSFNQPLTNTVTINLEIGMCNK